MKYITTSLVAFFVGIYTTFVAMYMWNWFAAPVLNLPYISFLQMLGLVWLIGILVDRLNPDETKWNLLLSVIELCVPNENREKLGEIVQTIKDNFWNDIRIKIFGQFVGNTVTLGLGFMLHVFIS
jgi:hypothetical protein